MQFLVGKMMVSEDEAYPEPPVETYHYEPNVLHLTNLPDICHAG